MPRAKNLDELDEAALAMQDDSSDEDYDNNASSKRSPKKKPQQRAAPASRGKGRRRRRNSYGSDEDDEEVLSEEEWSLEESVEEEPVERTKSGRPARSAAKARVKYEESDEEEEEAEFTDGDDDEDETPPPSKRKGGKKPSAKSQFAGKRATKRGRATAIQDSEDEDGIEEEQVKTPPKKPRLIVKLKTPGRGTQEQAPQMQRRSSRLHDTGDPLIQLTESGHHALPQPPALTQPTTRPTRGKTASPKGRGSRSRSAGLRDRATTPATAAAGPRRMTRAGSAALRNSAPPPDSDEDEEMPEPITKIEPEDDPGMSRITEESSLLNSSMAAPSGGESTSRNGLTNGTTSLEQGDGSFQPGTTSTSNAQDSLDASIPAREQSGLLTAKELKDDSGARRTRSSILHNTQTEGDFNNDADAPGESTNVDDMEVDDDEQPVSNRRRLTRRLSASKNSQRSTQSSRKSKGKKKASRGSDDESYNGEEDGSGSEEESEDNASKKGDASEDDEELNEELEELRPQKKTRSSQLIREASGFDSDGNVGRSSRKKGPVDYRIYRPENLVLEEGSSPPPTASTNRGRRGGGTTSSGFKSLFSTMGPFGGIGQAPAILGVGKTAAGMGGADSDSSDDEGLLPTGGAVGGPLSSGGARNSLSGGRPSAVGPGGTPANLGKITGKQKQLLADADPLGVDPNVDFSKVGGLNEQIEKLKDMVSLPLLYPEIFQSLNVTPPRGVLFHGPPGTGKTLLARALASSCSTEGRKISFYMRKGADCLSKWVGEAERQLRLLFEEARANQPSIIFFDEIDGLAPVRSSKQEQIHASIVSTLLALMDGMDGRGQVIVIGATNRPDSIDPALRRPGRFDREFYFPLPSKEARRSIIDIHTQGWTPPLKDDFKDELAVLTKGYGGADLRALCTEAALNAVQRIYPQIYKETNKRFLIDPKNIEVTARDFMLSVQKIVPSSERATTSGAAPLPEHIEPLLGPTINEIKEKIAGVLPNKKRLTALEEAEYEPDHDADGGFARERMMRDFEGARVFKPRLLVHGANGMGQNYIGGAILHHFEGFHVQTVNLPALMGDPTRTPEAALVQIFVELKRHKPSVLFIPDFDNWYSAVGDNVIKTFQHLLNSIAPSEPILLFGILSQELHVVDPDILRDYFGYSRKSRVKIEPPQSQQRAAYFQNVLGHIKKSPKDFPDPTSRPKRVLPPLKLAPQTAPEKQQSKAEREAIKKQETYILHLLKCRLMPLTDMLKQKYKRFKRPVVNNEKVKRAYEMRQQQASGDVIGSDLQPVVYEGIEVIDLKDGLIGVRDVQTGAVYYNLDLEVIEDRVFNGYYETTDMYMKDIKYLLKDAEATKDKQSIKESKEMLTNVVISLHELEMAEPNLISEVNRAYNERQERLKKRAEEAKRNGKTPRNNTETPIFSNPHPFGNSTVPQKRNHSAMMAPQTPLQGQMQRQGQMMETLPEETSTSNGYIASSEMGDPSKSGDGDGDLVMSDHGSNQTIQPPAGSQHSAGFQTAPSQNPFVGSQNQDGSGPFTVAGIVQSQNVTQTRVSSDTRFSVAVTSSQKQFEIAAHDASTTTSGKKTADETQSSGHSLQPIQRPNLTGGSVPLDFTASTVPDFQFGPMGEGDSQLPDTQVIPSSESSGVASQAFPHPATQQHNTWLSSQSNSHPSQNSPIVPIVNNALHHHLHHNALAGPSRIPPPPARPDPVILIDEEKLSALQDTLVLNTKDYSIEQLEQVNAALMDLVWKNRNNWDRNKIIDQADAVLKEVFEDIKEFNDLVQMGLGRHEEGPHRSRGRVY